MLTWAIIEAGGERGWTDGVVLGGFGVALAALVAFVAWELRSSAPMLDVRLFAVRRFSGASVSIALVFFALFGAIFFLTMYLQEVLDYGALEAGLRVTPIAAGLVLGGPVSAKLVGRLGTRNVVAAGLTIVAGAMLLLGSADAHTGYGLIGASLVLMGIGMGATMAPATESIMSSLPLAHAGVGSAMNDTVRMVGGTLGVAILGSLLSSSYGADMERAVQGLPPEAQAAAEGSIGGAGAVAEQIGGGAGATLNRVAETAFSSAMSGTLTVAAGGGDGRCARSARGATRSRARARREAHRARRSGGGSGVSIEHAKRKQDRAGAERAPARGRGRPRSEQAHRAIVEATLTLLDEGGYTALTIEAVAERAGVGKTTIYRRWPSKLELVIEAISELRPPGPPEDTGSLAGDFAAFARGQVSRVARTALPASPRG